MAGFTTKTFQKHDDYMTPFSAWANIKDYIPKHKVIWEAFYGDGESGIHLENLGFEVIHKEVDFFESNLGDIIVSNPPFSQCKEVLERLVKLDKPFIMILPSSKINTQYFRNLFGKNKNPIQIIIPRRRIQFQKLVGGKIPEGWKDACNFDCFYYCYKIGLERDIVWLD
jgi:hypothetical protein